MHKTGAIGGGFYHYEGSYRVDFENEQVYFIDAEYGTESLLYDFSMIPGDTIYPFGNTTNTLICLDTSTMIINNIPHQSYFIYSYLSNGTECYTTWVKGIGSLRMPIETDWFCAASFEWAYDLSCFYYKEDHIYEWDENPYFEGCIGSNVGIEEFLDRKIFTVAPNPVTGTSQLISNFPDNALFDYQILNMNGRIQKEEGNVKAEDIILQNNNFQKGIYLLHLYAHNNERYYSIKFIIN